MFSLRDWFRRQPRARSQLRCNTLQLGSSYGAYAIAPDAIDPGAIVYSFGIGEDISFDLALLERFDCTVHAFDPTPRSLAWLAGQRLPERMFVHDYGLADRDGTLGFVPPPNPNHVSHSTLRRSSSSTAPIAFPVKRLATIMRELGHERLDILKMDIEGSEYAVIDDLLRGEIRPRQLLLEFHHQLPGVRLSQTERALSALEASGYRIFDRREGGQEFSLLYGAPSA